MRILLALVAVVIAGCAVVFAMTACSGDTAPGADAGKGGQENVATTEQSSTSASVSGSSSSGM